MASPGQTDGQNHAYPTHKNTLPMEATVRRWNVNEDEIYACLSDPDFADEVDRIVQDAIGESYRIAG